MTDKNNETGSNSDNNSGENTGAEGVTIEHKADETRATKPAGWSFPKLSLAVGAAMAALIGIGAVTAQSAGGGEGWGMHRMMGDNGKGGRHGGMGGFMGHRLSGVLEDAGASQEQIDKIKTIVEQARTDMEPLRDGMRESRGELMTLLSAPTVDTAAIEKLRSERVASMDEASKKAVASFVEAANVLTPEQRAKLATEFEQMKDRGGRN